MFWYLLLAHFLADYPLQTSWMVANKRRLPVLAMHAGVHFLTMVALVGSAWKSVWFYLLLLALIHFSIDTGKNLINVHRPNWVILPYIVDQGLHYLSILGISIWISQAVPGGMLPFSSKLAVYLTGFLFATYVWFISERVLTYASPLYREEVVAQAWSRMLTRAGLVGILLWGVGQITPATSLSASAAALPYFSGNYGRRALLTDVGVALGVLVFILLAA
jgi:hypothetical protein